MRIEQLMTRSPKACQRHCSLSHAARLMWENDLGCLPITEGDEYGRLVGMVTDRDICMTAYFAGRALNEVLVAEAMTTDVYACNPGDEIAEAGAIMRETAVRRLPVIDESERVIGLLSLADIARNAIRQRGAMKKNITVAEVGLVLASICEPRGVAKRTQVAAPGPSLGSSPERRSECR